ncbi:MAG: ATP-binding protein [Arenicella sp.]
MLSALNRYRAIIISIVIFLLLIVAILIENVFLSSKLEQEAHEIRLASRQGMLSQRISKALSKLYTEYNKGNDYLAPLQELEQSIDVFDTTILAFKDGGSIDIDGLSINVRSPKVEEKVNLLMATNTLWQPYNARLQEVIKLLAQGRNIPIQNKLQAAVISSGERTGVLLEEVAKLSNEFKQSDAVPLAVTNIVNAQSMLTERISQSLLHLQLNYVTHQPFGKELSQLRDSVRSFDAVVQAVKFQGVIKTDSGTIVEIPEVNTFEASQALAKIENLWFPYKEQILNATNELTGHDGSARFVLNEANDALITNGDLLFSQAGKLIELSEKLDNSLILSTAQRLQFLSQSMARATLALQESYLKGGDYSAVLDEFIVARDEFDTTLELFEKEGLQDSGEDNVAQQAFSLSGIRQNINEIQGVWDPVRETLFNVEKELKGDSDAEGEVLKSLADSFAYSNEHSATLLSMSEKLSQLIEVESVETASASRLVQIVGIFCAIVFFSYIMFQFFGRLRKVDSELEKSEQETKQIFETVGQGLFLFDKNNIVGEQVSNEIKKIFSRDEISGKNFIDIIKPCVTENDLEKFERFSALLFDPHKKARLIAELNPLDEVSAQVQTESGIKSKYLRFNFSRVGEKNEIKSVLASVVDITKEVELRQQLKDETKRNNQQLGMLSSLLNTNHQMLPVFINNAKKALETANELLRSTSRTTADFKRKAIHLMELVHGVKGDSAALSIDLITQNCHDFESKAKEIQSLEEVDGNDFLGLTVLLNNLIEALELLDDTREKVFGNKEEHQPATESPAKTSNWEHLFPFVEQMAQRQGKDVCLQYAGLESTIVNEEQMALLNTMTSQFVRNSIAHGIEVKANRLAKKKPEKGKIQIALYRNNGSDFEYFYSDDGAGIDIDKVLALAIEKKVVSKEVAATMNRNQIANLIFHDSLSTSDEVDADSGRGVGMGVIRDAIKQLKGRVQVKSVIDAGTAFRITFPMQ